MRTVELLEQHDPGELVGQGHRPQREAVIDADQRRRPEGAAHHKREVAPGAAALLQEGAEGEAVV